VIGGKAKRKVQASLHFQRFNEFSCKKEKNTNFFPCQLFVKGKIEEKKTVVFKNFSATLFCN